MRPLSVYLLGDGDTFRKPCSWFAGSPITKKVVEIVQHLAVKPPCAIPSPATPLHRNPRLFIHDYKAPDTISEHSTTPTITRIIHDVPIWKSTPPQKCGLYSTSPACTLHVRQNAFSWPLLFQTSRYRIS